MNHHRVALVTCAAQNASLACARSLYRAGWRVIMVDDDRRAKGFASRACDHYELLPSLADEPDRYAEQIIKYLMRHHIDLLVPVTDAAIFALLPYKDTLERLTNIPWPSPASLRAAVDKVQTFALAEKLGIGIPRSVTLADKQSSLPTLEYPVVIKPQQQREGGGKLPVDFADEEAVLRKALEKLPDDAYPVLVQERIVGPGEGYFAVWRHGEPVVECAHRRRREKPPSGGVSTSREAIDLPDDMREPARKLLREWRWHGPVMVEFKRSRKSGKPYLMEVNGRLWGSLQLAIDAGIDIPVASAAVALDQDVPPMQYRPGVRTVWMKGDFEAWLSRMFNPVNLPSDDKGRLRWTLGVIGDFFNPRTYRDSWRWNDRGPFWRDMRGLWKTIYAKLRKLRFESYRLPVAMHVHSRFSYDGEMSVADIARMCDSKGIRVCCLAEHSDQLTQEDVDRMVQACANHSDKSLLLVPGIEFSLSGGMHLIGYGVTELLTVSDPVALCRQIRECGGISVLAHPKPGMPAKNPLLARELDGAEVWNTGHDGSFVPDPRRLHDYREARRFNKNLLAMHGVDFHRPGNMRRVRTWLPEEDMIDSLTWPNVRDNLLAARYRSRSGIVTVRPFGAYRPSIAVYQAVRAAMGVLRPLRRQWRRLKRIPHWEYVGCPHTDCPARTARDGASVCWRTTGSFAGHDERIRPECPKDCRDCDYYRYVNKDLAGARRIRLLHLIETGNPGGAEHLMINLIHNLDPNRFTSQVVLIKEGWLAERFRQLGVQVTVLPLAKRFNLRFLWRLMRLVRRRKIDLLHSHEFSMNVYSFVVRYLARKPTVATVHGNLSYIAARYRRRFAYRTLARLAGPLLVVSEDMKEQVGKLFKLEEHHLQVIHNGTVVPKYLPSTESRLTWREEMGLPVDAFLLGVIGSLYPVKGQGTLLEAMPQLIAIAPQVHLAVVGRGKMREALERQAEELGIADHVTFTGYREDVREKLACFDLIVVPSKYEGLSLLVVESMAAGRPVIATHVGGNPEAIEDGVSGLLVPPNDAEALVMACRRVIDDPALAEQLGHEARQRVQDRFSLMRMVERYQDYYLRLLGRER